MLFEENGSPIIQLIAYLDQNRRANQAIFVTFWDMTKAFDSPSKNMLRTALMRLAVPAEWCDWFIKMDMEGGVIPKSPVAQELLAKGLLPWEFPDIQEEKETASRFTTRRGCSQGDPPSPSHWDAFFDILMRALELGSQEPCVLLGKNRLPHHLGDAAFIDDLTTASPSYITLQRAEDRDCLRFRPRLLPQDQYTQAQNHTHKWSLRRTPTVPDNVHNELATPTDPFLQRHLHPTPRLPHRPRRRSG